MTCPTVEDFEDEDDIQQKKNIPPKNSQHILELSEEDNNPSTSKKPRGQHSQVSPIVDNEEDNEDTYPTHAKKSQKRLKGKSTVVESSEDPNLELDQGKKKQLRL